MVQNFRGTIGLTSYELLSRHWCEIQSHFFALLVLCCDSMRTAPIKCFDPDRIFHVLACKLSKLRLSPRFAVRSAVSLRG